MSGPSPANEPVIEPASSAAAAPPSGRSAEPAAAPCRHRHHVIPTGVVFATLLESLNRGASSRLLIELAQLFEKHCACCSNITSADACTLCVARLSAELSQRIADRVAARRASGQARARRRRAAQRRSYLVAILLCLGLLAAFLAGLLVGQRSSSSLRVSELHALAPRDQIG